MQVEFVCLFFLKIYLSVNFVHKTNYIWSKIIKFELHLVHFPKKEKEKEKEKTNIFKS
jgi:hypothetical protein